MELCKYLCGVPIKPGASNDTAPSKPLYRHWKPKRGKELAAPRGLKLTTKKRSLTIARETMARELQRAAGHATSTTQHQTTPPTPQTNGPTTKTPTTPLATPRHHTTPPHPTPHSSPDPTHHITPRTKPTPLHLPSSPGRSTERECEGC